MFYMLSFILCGPDATTVHQFRLGANAEVGFVVSLGGSGVVLLLLLQEVLSFNPTSSVMAVVSVGEAKAFLAHGPRSKGHVGV